MNSINNPAPYKLLIKGVLTQLSAFSTGGNDPFEEQKGDTETRTIDSPLAKDGKGLYTIRGQGLAGALVATARELYPDLTSKISEGSPEQQPKRKENSLRINESVWLFHHAHPINGEAQAEIRDHVSIRQKTGAAKHGAKFDVEILPVGTQWSFLMEVDEYRDTEKGKASSIALNAIQQWATSGCWLGRDVARGLGWMKLDQLEVFRLTSKDITLWPDSSAGPFEVLKNLSINPLETEEVKSIQRQHSAEQIPCQLSGQIDIHVGEPNEDGYGLDMLSVGGISNIRHTHKHQGKSLGKNFLQSHRDKVIKPLGVSSDSYLKFSKSSSGDVDFNIATTVIEDGKLTPHIPGSSLRGAMRHALSWWWRKKGESVWEPGGENNYPKADNDKNEVLDLFGSTKNSANLLISDALPQQDTSWQLLVQEMHAEDEFTQGALEGSKFDRTCLTQGAFTARFHLTANTEDKLEKYRQELNVLNLLGQNRMMPLGGGQWKGLGWVRWNITFDEGTSNKSQEDRA
jgi:CRISPR/Cas system CSM-associated protein Csm3 (group 7 of RAMP superfamily)